MRCQPGLLLVVGWLSAAALADHPAPAILPLREVRAGQTGQGRTVVSGTLVESFDFQVLDILEAEGFATNLILVKVGGPLIDRLGGIAAGMSGSPLFIDGRLIGAVAFTTPFSDTRYGYATPIEDMLKVLDLSADLKLPTRTAALSWLPAGTPVFVSGLGAPARACLGRFLARHGHRLHPTDAAPVGPVPPETTAGELVEGAAVAASLTTGDIVLTALGTLSYRDQDRVLAFGHPFLQRGDTSIFLHPAYIYGVVPATDLAFKIGAPAGPPVGAFLQDRAAGLGGRLGRAADSVKLDIVAEDRELGRSRALEVQVVRDDELAPTLVAVAVVQGMAEVMDRLGGGTAEMSWTVEGEGLPRPLVRQDMIYSSDDIIGEAVPGPLFTLDALFRNDFAAVRPAKVLVRVNVSRERRTVRLVDVKVRSAPARPGGELALRVRLQPYRGKILERELTLKVPADTPPGKLVLELHGRPDALSGPLSQAALLARGIAPPASLAELLAALASTQRGNVLLAELLTPEAFDARRQLMDRLGSMPELDLFSEEVTSLPAAGTALEPGGVLPLARAESSFEQVVQGRLSTTVTVAGP